MYDIEKENYALRTLEALRQLTARQSGPGRLRQPLAMIGPSDATPAQRAAAYRVARALAATATIIICGGKGGVMEAASHGAHDADGLVIGMLPDDDSRHANRYLSVAIASGMGEMRNAVIARSALCLVAIGGGLGTISEMALGLKWGKPVFAMLDAEQVPGTRYFEDEDSLLYEVAMFLALHQPAG